MYEIFEMMLAASVEKVSDADKESAKDALRPRSKRKKEECIDVLSRTRPERYSGQNNVD
jgi:hypothetical protein